MGAVVLGMEVAAVAVAVFGFGRYVLLVGLPLIVVTVLIVLVAAASERGRRRRQARAAAADAAVDAARAADPNSTVILDPAVRRGLMSGFFELPGTAPRPSRPGPPPR